MKKLFMIIACLCLLTVSALAVEPSDFEYETEAGTYVINWNRYYYAVAQEKLAESGVVLDLNDYVSGSDDTFTFDNDAFESDYAAALKAMENSVESVAVDNASADSIESVNEPSLDAVTDISDETETSDEMSESLVYQVVDMRSDVSVLSVSDDGVESAESGSSGVLSGLKELLFSIFGEYTPVMTTSPVMETVDNVTTTTLIDTVAPGVAGMDWPWIAGVFLFAVVLWSFFRCVGVLLQK